MEVSKTIYMYVLGALIVLGMFTVIGLLILVPMPKENEQLLLLALGALIAKFSDVIGYFFGSSKSSSDKDKVISDQLQK